jgi:hypothetical protein
MWGFYDRKVVFEVFKISKYDRPFELNKRDVERLEKAKRIFH